MKYTALLYLTISIFLFACSDDSHNESIDFKSEYPDADAVYIKLVKEYTLNKDGSVNMHYYHKLKYLTYYSIHRLFGETFIAYNPEYQKLKINKCVTFMNDGKEIAAPENAFNEMLPYFAKHAPSYNHLKEMVITHTGLEPGAIVELDYNIESNKDFFPYLLINETAEKNCPVRNLEYIIRIPKEIAANYSFPEDFKIEKDENDNFIIYKLNYTNLSAVNHEKYMDYSNLHNVLFSTGSLNQQIKSLVNNPEFNSDMFPQAEEYLNSLNQDDNKERVKSIANYVANSLNTYDIPLYYTAYRYRGPEQVWKSNGGTEFEKTLLLHTLLKNTGIENNIVFTISNVYDTANVNLNNIKNFYIEINDNNKPEYLSAVQSGAINVNEINVCVYQLNDNSKIKSFAAEKKSTDIEGVLNIDKTNFNGIISLTISDNLRSDNDDFMSFISCKVNNTSNENNKIKFNISNEIKEKAGYLFIELPYFKENIEKWNIKWLNTEKKSNMILPWTATENYQYKIPLNNEIKYVGQNTDTIVDFNTGKAHIKINELNDTLNIIRRFELNNKNVSVKDYSEFKKALDLWNNKTFRQLVFKKI
ncbi:MAG: hypothetical protein Kow0068_17700 [Marinilabiliales bacterium]